MRKFGLAAILTFVDKGATAAMGRVGRRAALLKKQFQGVGRGLSQMRRGLGSMATAALPVAAGFGLMLKKGADFEQAVARLKAVTLDKFDPALKSLAKTLGSTTKFSATEAADAMTALARAGLDTKEIMGAIRGTLNAAAAEGIGLADAADLVASNIKAFNIDAAKASQIAGVLALASARTNTTMLALQEGLKLAAPAVKPLNVSLVQTTALLGALADIGLKGTLGGTAIRASVAKLLKPTSDAKKAMAQLGLSLTGVRKRLDKGDLVGVFKDLVAKMKDIPKASKRAELASRILGIRGQTMAAALNLSKKNMDKFNETLKALQKETGETARRMKEIQLKTVIGQLTILKSAFEGVSIELFDLISGKTRGLVERMSGSLGNLALAMRVVSGEKITDKETLDQLKTIPKSFFEIARGIREAFSDLGVLFRAVGLAIADIGKMFGITGDGSAKSVARIVTKVVLLTAAFAPLSLVLGGVTRLFGGLASTAIGAGRAIFGTLGIAAKGGTGLFRALAGKAGAVGRIAEQATAQPVRVVNFHELALGGLGAKTGFIGPIQQITPALTRFRVGLNSLAGKVPLIGGMLAGNLDKASLAAGGLKGALGRAGLVGVVGGLAFALGGVIDRATGASTKLSDLALAADAARRKQFIEPAEKRIASLEQTIRSAESLKQLVALSQKGIKFRTGKGAEAQVITRELARARLVESLRKSEFNQKQIATQLARLAPILARLPTAAFAARGFKPVAAKPIKPAKDALVNTGGLIPVSAGDVVLDRASLAGAVVSQMRGGLSGAAGAGALGGGDPGRTSPPSAASSGMLRIEVPVEVDGVAIARAVAEVRLDELERGGASLAPGDRRSAFERGTMGGG